MPTLRIFVDANVLFSACVPGSRAGSMLREAFDRFEVSTCAIAIEEARRNLGRKKPAWLPQMDILEKRLGVVPESPAPAGVSLPQIDGILLGSAAASHCDFFVTGDLHHFGRLFGQTIEGLRILSPAMFVNEHAR